MQHLAGGEERIEIGAFVEGSVAEFVVRDLVPAITGPDPKGFLGQPKVGGSLTAGEALRSVLVYCGFHTGTLGFARMLLIFHIGRHCGEEEKSPDFSSDHGQNFFCKASCTGLSHNPRLVSVFSHVLRH